MTATPDAVTVDAGELANLEHLVETLEEALIDQQMAYDERGWAKIGDLDAGVVSREQIRAVASRARIMSIADPLIRRAVNLRVAYVWGSGLTIGAADADDDGGQDVNAVVQAFLVDQGSTFASLQACEERERALMCSGNQFLCLPTDPLTGRVQVRRISDSQVDDIITDPEDAETPWFYKRTWTATVVEAGYAGGTRRRRETRTVYYPALGYRPRQRPKTIDGKPVEWDSPVLHVRVNRLDGSLWGTSDLWAALDWAEGYKDFLVDWARLVKALSRFAFRATAKTGRAAAQVRSRITATEGVGDTVVTAEGAKFEAIGKSGATIDSRSGLPLAAQVAAGTDIPVTMLTSDPGQTGARATAETLDKPLALVTGMRRALGGEVILDVLNHVIDSAIKAPRGPLTGTLTIDPVTGAETYTLSGGQDRGVFVDWPSLEDVDTKTALEAIKVADDLGKLPPLVIARLALVALHVDNPDEILNQITDPDTGEFVDPNLASDAAAAAAAIAAFRRGENPAAVLAGAQDGEGGDEA